MTIQELRTEIERDLIEALDDLQSLFADEERCCEECGEIATRQVTYLYKNARSNRASSGYGKDDISLCSDGVAYTCNACVEKVQREGPDGMDWCSTTFGKERYPHLFTHRNRPAESELKAALESARGALAAARGETT